MTMRWRVPPLLGLMVGVSAFVPFTSRGEATGQTRTYYLAADEVTWDHAPGGLLLGGWLAVSTAAGQQAEIGRASCRERV